VTDIDPAMLDASSKVCGHGAPCSCAMNAAAEARRWADEGIGRDPSVDAMFRARIRRAALGGQ
jgi:hypothetical protein